ncbi:MAG TPA: hypothetical protein VES73_10200 [Lamprocystis sp. (in: g-proteobacteria)]|nr:hypothetical protein [Lamprocystis sp. (in: g-proteobacteria)]
MKRRTVMTLARSLGLTLGLAIVTTPAVVETLDQPAAPAGVTVSDNPSTGAITKPGAGKLKLGLGDLAVEYQARQSAAAQRLAPSGALAPRSTLARVVDGQVVIDAVAVDADPQALKTALEALGATVTGVAGRMVSARIPLDRIPLLETLDTLKFARPALGTA